jgi:hypothetical protein
LYGFLYMDEDSCDARLVARLRELTVDVVSACEAGREGVADFDQLAYATETERPIVTANYKDFVPLHTRWAREGREHSGIIIWKQETRSPESLAELLLALCADRTEAQFQNALIWIR